jgi:hypothetical protein
MPNNQPLEKFLELAPKEIYQLLGELEINNRLLNSYIDSRENSPETSEIINELSRRGVIISKVIIGRPVKERIDYISGTHRLFQLALETDRYELAEELRDEIRYFKHCFLEGIAIDFSSAD